jgi:xylulokinase
MLKPEAGLREQLFPAAFSHPYSPNWQDHSTAVECKFIEDKIGGAYHLADITGSKAHHVS